MSYKTHTENLKLRSGDCDLAGAWMPGALLVALQEASEAHSILLGAGREDLRKLNIAWVLTRLEVDMDSYPLMEESVSIETFHAPVRRWFFPRYYILRDAKGEAFGRAASLWVLFDLTTRRMLRPESLPVLFPDNSDLPAPLGLPAPVTEVSGLMTQEIRRPVYTDLDANRHVNNTKYMDWCCNAIGIDTLERMELAHFAINYDTEAVAGDEIRTEYRRLGSDFSYSGFHGEKRCFDIGGTLRPRTRTAR